MNVKRGIVIKLPVGTPSHSLIHRLIMNVTCVEIDRALDEPTDMGPMFDSPPGLTCVLLDITLCVQLLSLSHVRFPSTSSNPDSCLQVQIPVGSMFESRAACDIIMFDSQRGGATMKEILKIRLFIGCTWHHYVWQPKGRGYHERNFFENKTVDFFGYLKRTLSAKAKVNAKRPRLTYGKENGPGHDKRFQ